YGAELREGLLDIARDWREQLSSGGQKRLRLFSKGVVFRNDAEDQAAMLDELDRLAKLRSMKESDEDDRTTEREGILDWLRVESLYRRGKYNEALASCERAETGLPSDGEKLRKRLADSMKSLARKFIWPESQGYAVYSPEAERLLSKVVGWLPDEPSAWYNLGVTFEVARKFDQAIAAYGRATELDPKFAAPHNELGNVYLALN